MHDSFIIYKQYQLVATLKAISEILDLNCVGPASAERKKNLKENRRYSDCAILKILGNDGGKVVFFFGGIGRNKEGEFGKNKSFALTKTNKMGEICVNFSRIVFSLCYASTVFCFFACFFTLDPIRSSVCPSVHGCSSNHSNWMV